MIESGNTWYMVRSIRKMTCGNGSKTCWMGRQPGQTCHSQSFTWHPAGWPERPVIWISVRHIRDLEIGGTWYGLEFQHTIVNTECKYLLLRYAFETLGTIRVQFKADLRNERSLRAIERIGAKREGILRNHMVLPDGVRRDSVFYSIIDSEWPEVKDRLEEKLGQQAR